MMHVRFLRLLSALVALGLAADLRHAQAADTAPDPGPEALVNVAALRASVDRTAVEPDALANELGPSPDALARFVREKIRLETYPGVLRGARGTLIARAGNSWDRAVLLHELCRLAGHRVRFAWATLTNAQAESLVRAGLAASTPAVQPTPEQDQILGRAEAHFFLLGDALHAAGYRFGPPGRTAWEQAVSEARDHAWVEIEVAGVWKGLDPSPGAGPWSTLVPAEGTADSPAEQKFHRVHLAMEVEVSGANGLTRDEVLQHGETTAALAGVPVGLVHEVSGASVTPILLVGDREIRGNPFGAVSEPDDEDDSGGLGFGGGLGLGRVAGSAPPSNVSGAWLRIRSSGPAGANEAVYTILDRGGPAARAAGRATNAPLAGVEDLGGVFLGMSFAGGAVSPVVPWAILAETGNRFDARGLTRLLSLHSFLYFVLRPALADAHLGRGADWHLDAPNVVIARAEISAADIGLGLARKSYRILRAPEDPAAPSSFHDYLASGVIDHTLERALMRGEREQSVGAAIETAREEAIPIGILPPGAERDLQLLSADGRRFASAAWSEGKLLAMPARRPKGLSGDLGWWEVDPGNGFTVDTLESGGHQANVETSQMNKDPHRKAKAICLLAIRVAVTGIDVAAHALEAGTPASEIVKGIKSSGASDIIDDLVDKVCGGTPGPPGPKPNRMPPGWKPFPDGPKNFPDRSPNPFKNPPATRWPPGAPRGR